MKAITYMSVILAMALLMVSFGAAAQEVTQHFDVPESGYSGTDTYISGDLWNEYIIHVPLGNELVYTITTVNDGTLSVGLIPGSTPTIYSYNYDAFSSTGEVSSYTTVFPADFGFDHDYSIVVNSSSDIDVLYTVDIHIQKAETTNYTLYYILLALGMVGLVIFSYKFVVWQEKKEKEKKKSDRRKRKR